MEKVATFDRNSWHGRLYTKYTADSWAIKGNTNICSYIRGVIRGFIWAIVIASVVGCYLGALAATIISVYFGQFDMENPLTTVTVIITSAAAIVGSAIGIAYLLSMWQDNNYGDVLREKLGLNPKVHVYKEPGFLKLAYRKFKEKTCFKVGVK
jgi:hypothetical protein